MASIFALMFLLSIVVAIVGFILMFIKRKQENSKLYRNIGLCGILGFVVFFILTGITAPDTPETEKATVAETTTVTEAVKGSQTEPTVEESTVETTPAATEETKPETSEETTEEAQPETIALITKEEFDAELGEVKPTWYSSVRNDKTGNWRMLVVYTTKQMDGPLTKDYCNAYWGEDSEVHFIVNLYLKTTTVINKFGDLASVTIHEYKDGEEHDAKELAGGMVYKEFTVNLATGEILE